MRNSQGEIMLEDPGERRWPSLSERGQGSCLLWNTENSNLRSWARQITSHMDKVQPVKKAWKPNQLRASLLQEYSEASDLGLAVIPRTETHLLPFDSTLGRPLVADEVSGMCSVAEKRFHVDFLMLPVVDCCHEPIWWKWGMKVGDESESEREKRQVGAVYFDNLRE